MEADRIEKKASFEKSVCHWFQPELDETLVLLTGKENDF